MQILANSGACMPVVLSCGLQMLCAPQQRLLGLSVHRWQCCCCWYLHRLLLLLLLLVHTRSEQQTAVLQDAYEECSAGWCVHGVQNTLLCCIAIVLRGQPL